MSHTKPHSINFKKQLSDVWLKAAILGSTWAASEIILGSFLHNLRIPFNGNILTAIGLILMISASYIWKDKGLFWRSGLICALMKTMSPSAIIFGPMIAIFAEAMLMEISIRTLGRNALGFIVGGALAMSWILVQKIVNFIIFYGLNIVEVYSNLMVFAERQLHTQFDMVWLPIFALLILYIIFGVIAVWIGMSIGKKLLSRKELETIKATSSNSFFQHSDTKDFPYSLVWLILNFTILVLMLFIINVAPIYVWISITFLIIFIWTRRYQRAIKQLSKPKFWLFFVIITMLTAFVMTYIQDETWTKGLIIGLQMNFRAAIVIVGFAVIGTELYNPRVRDFFSKSSFKQLPVALELAFDTLPSIISNLPEVKQFFKQPVQVISQLMGQAELRFLELKKINRPLIFILKGALSGGKTTFLMELIQSLKHKNLMISGFYSPRILNNNETTGYHLNMIETGFTYPFLTKSDIKTSDIGIFKVDDNTLRIANQYLKSLNRDSTQLVIIDEVGRWELQHKGWYESIEYLNQQAIPQLWVVRDSFVEDVKSGFSLNNTVIIDCKRDHINDATNLILSRLNIN